MSTIEGYRLSPQQKRLWLLQQAGDSQPYRVQCAAQIEGKLDVDALRRAIETVIRRHEILRTTFVHLHGMGMPVQVVRDYLEPHFQEHDLSDLSQREQDERIDHLFHQALSTRFELEDGLIVRVSVVAQSDTRSVLLISLPAVCADAAALRNFVREIEQAYSIGGGDESFLEAPAQYADISEWFHQLIENQGPEERDDDCRDRLLSAFRVPLLPFEREAQTEIFEPRFYRSAPLPAALFSAVEECAETFGVSPEVFLLCCWQTLLWRLNGETQSIVGCAFAARRYEELKAVLGPCIRYLPVASQLDTGLRFSELLRQTNERVTSLHRCQEYFDWERSAQSGDGLDEIVCYRAGFSYEEMPLAPKTTHTHFSLSKIHTCLDRFKVRLYCLKIDAHLNIEFQYDHNFYLSRDIEALAKQFHALLESAAACPEEELSKLRVADPAESASLLLNVNRRQAGAPEAQCVHQLFEEQARRTPDNLALVFEDREITYGQLNGRANQLARYLRKMGVGPEVLVPIYAERSIETVIGIIATLKAGGAFLPLDPAFPKERINFILDDARASVLLTQEQFSSRFEGQQVNLVGLNDDANVWRSESQENLQVPVLPGNAAYAIFTSGSTGQPKGVVIEHRQLCNYVSGILRKLQPTPQSSYALISSLAADLGYTSLFSSLCSGGRLHLLPSSYSLEAELVADYFRRHQIDILKITPSHISALLASTPHVLPRKCIVLGGEACGWSLVDKLTQLAPDLSIFNHYGPTETTIGCIALQLAQDREQYESKTPPLGNPLEHTEAYILDDNLQLLPCWMPGHLFIGGRSLARGYLARPHLTALSFIPHPFSNLPGQRLYRTGDMARLLPGGSIEFLGRSDRQVKVRGYRVELEEVEALLRQAPGVRAAVVQASSEAEGEASGGPRLVAYVASERQGASEERRLREYMIERVVEQMVPVEWVVVEELPLRGNGKVDAGKLEGLSKEARRRDGGAGEGEVERGEVRDEIEEAVWEIWKEVLEEDEVGVDENFFDVGGHSLIAMQVMLRVRERLGVELTVQELFEWPTISLLARQIKAGLRGGDKLPAFPLVSVNRDQGVPLSYAQQRLWFFDQLHPANPAYNIPLALKLLGHLNTEALRASLQQVIHRHEALRTTFTLAGHQPLQIIHPSLHLHLPLLDLSTLPASDRSHQARLLAQAEARTGFDLRQGPLLRARLLRLEEQEHWLLLTMHHIVSDGWSMGVLLREIKELYGAGVRGEESRLGELPIQYADYAVWQREWLSAGGVAERQLSYWREQLRGVGERVMQIGGGGVRRAVQRYEGGREEVVIGAEVVEGLREVGRAGGATLFMVLLASFKVLVMRYSGEEEVVVGTPVANRNRVETEGLIGFFVNALVMRTDLSGQPTFEELLKRVRSVALAAYANQDVPFERVVEELQPERRLSHHPLFQVMFVHNAPLSSLKLPGLSVSLFDVPDAVAKFDLTLSLREAGDEVQGALEYNTDLFNRSFARSFIDSFRALLAAFAANPSLPVSAAPLLSAEQRRLLLQHSNQTPSSSTPPLCLHQLFEQQVKRTPQAIALHCAGRSLSYEELERRANQLAHYLRGRGVGVEQVVGISMERGVEMVVAVLGVLKAGGAYLPLDVREPAGRLVQMVEEAGARLVLTSGEEDAGRWEEEVRVRGVEVVRVDGEVEREEIGQQSEEGVESGVGEENLAYVIYTSDSAKLHKGVIVSHEALANYLLWCVDHYVSDKFSSVPVFTSLASELTVTSLFVPLLAGKSVMLIAAERGVEAVGAALLNGTNFSFLKLTPSHLKWLQGMLPPEQPSGCVATLVVSGERLFSDELSFWSSKWPGTKLINEYWPAEAVAGHCAYETLIEDLAPGAVPIGRPLEHTEAYILDDNLQLLPCWMPGHLFIGGGSLARGYLARPNLTALSFIPHPFSDLPGQRLYRTGDMARLLPGGSIEFLGRSDRQVKVRGYRVELEEVEALLRQAPGVRAAVVQASSEAEGEASGSTRLVAYVASERQGAGEERRLREYMIERVVEQMVPVEWVVVEELPLRGNGKVDAGKLEELRKEARRRDGGAGEGEVERGEVRDEIEEAVWEIWKEVLEEDEVGVDENFFDVGGHSLIAMQVMLRVRERLGVELTVQELFEWPTISLLAQRVRQAQIEQDELLEADELIDEVERLSSEEIQRMLESKRSADG